MAEAQDDGIAWVPYGPASADSPSAELRAYARLQQRNCDGEPDGLDGDSDHIFRGALSACLALLGDSGAWDRAAQELADVHGPGDDDCLEQQAYAFLRQAVTAHRHTPGAPLRITSATRTSACTPTITRAEATVSDGAVVSIEVFGSYLWDVTSATVDNQAADVLERNAGSVVLAPHQTLPLGTTVPVAITQGQLPRLTTTVTIPDGGASPSTSPSPSASPDASVSPDPGASP